MASGLFNWGDFPVDLRHCPFGLNELYKTSRGITIFIRADGWWEICMLFDKLLFQRNLLNAPLFVD